MEISVLAFATIIATFICQSSGSDELVKSINDFSLNIFDEISRMKANDNVVISPFSLSMAMGMLLQGTSGDTEKEIADTIFKGLAKDVIAKKFKQLTQVDLAGLLTDNPNVTVTVANKVCVKKGSVMKREFVDALQLDFNATAESIDFGDKQNAADRVNAWASMATKGKIPNILDPKTLPDDTSLLVMNAIYLKGLWLHPFKEQATRKAKFLAGGSVPVDVDMMRGMFSVYRSEGDILSPEFPVQSFVLQYLGKRMSMIVLLPAPAVKIDDILVKLNSTEVLSKIFSETTKSAGQVTLQMPRFKISQDYHLMGTLKNLGIKNWNDLSKALEPGSDNLEVSGVMQKAVIEVNEKSTEAAAVTAITITNRSLFIRKEIEVNRPFIYIVRDDLTELILFIGKVMDPTKA